MSAPENDSGHAERWAPNEANYRAFTRMRILAGLLVVLLIAAGANVIWAFAIPGYEKLALVCAAVAMSVFFMRFPSPSEMQRLLEWKGRKTMSSEDLEYTSALLDRMVLPTVVLVVASSVGLALLDMEAPYTPYIVAGVVCAVFLAVGLFAAPLRRRRKGSNRHKR